MTTKKNRLAALLLAGAMLLSGCASSKGDDRSSSAADDSSTGTESVSKVSTSADDPSGFVLLSEAVPDAILEIRYYSTYNFVGDRIDGYEEPLAFLTIEAAGALKEVSDDLKEQGYRLKIFDAYRPQMAVTNFMEWAKDVDDTRMKEYFYPELDKSVLFDQGYIAEKSGHSRGSTVDLTLFDMRTEKEVDMGGTFDYFGELSHPDYKEITDEQYANRMILRDAMLAHGFKPLEEEWWHFTLENEPYPDTYFTFPINSEVLGAGAGQTAAEDENSAPEITMTSGSRLEYWSEDSDTAQSIIDYVAAVADESSDSFVPEDERIAVFDVDGTLLSELSPTYFDQCLMLHRILHDDEHEALPDNKAYAEELEAALLAGKPEPDSDKSSGQILAEEFKGLTEYEYREYIRDFMKEPAYGFEGMTYGESFYKPMVSVVDYLSDNGFKVFICSGAERTLLRELTKDTLGEWVPPYQIIGTTFSLAAEDQGDTEGRKYNMSADEKIIFEGNMTFKNQKMNKVVSIIDEIGAKPILSFGNSSGDISMAQYTVQNGGRAYMLLCDDTQRDYGDIETAKEFEAECSELGFETVSMKNDFATIYGENVSKSSKATDDGKAA